MTAARGARRGRRPALVLVVVVALLGACSSSGGEGGTIPGQEPKPGSPVTEAWAEIARDLDAPAGDRSASSCHRGEPGCLAAVVVEMEMRLQRLGCVHTAPFAFTYLEMTRGVAESVPSFDDPALISVVDARFAQLYFDAFDNWAAGNRDDVPAAWQLAFATAERGQSSAALDLVLGMNAHISRDLPYVVASAIAADATIEGEPDDYRLVNEIIGDVKGPMLAAAAERFDPGLFLLDADLEFEDAPDPVAMISQWRSVAFELGLRLAGASSAEEQRAVTAEIERQSAAAAGVLIAAAAVEGTEDLVAALVGDGAAGFLSPTERDRFCEEQLRS